MNRTTRVLRHPATIVVAILLAFFIGRSIGGGPTPRIEETTRAAVDEGPQLYTCSMHPSVRLPDPDAKCPICFMDLIPVTGDGGPGAERQLRYDEATLARAGVETTPVRRFFPEAEVRLYGKITFDQSLVERLTAWFPGRIERLFLDYVGVPVQRGEHVAEMYSPELVSAFAELREAARSARAAESMSPVVGESSRGVLEAARKRLRLLGVEPELIEAAERGTHEGDRITITSPMAGVVTDLQVREGDYVDTGEPIATVADLTRLWLDLEAYESQLSRLAWGQTASFTVESLPGQVFEGRIAFIEPFVDAATRTAAVRIAVDNADGDLKPGMFATAVVRTRVDATGAVPTDELAGRWVSPMHPTVVKDGPGQCDVCGMDLVPAEQLGVVGDPTAVRPPLVIPRSAVMFTGRRSIVYVRVPGQEMPTFEAREVLIGPRAGDFVTVSEGLDEGERVVSQGAFRIDSDMQIAAKPSMMMPASGGSEETPLEVPEAFVASLLPLVEAYLAWQEALADDDAEAARSAVADYRTALDAVRAEQLVGPALGEWRRLRADLSGEIRIESIETQRVDFEPVSDAILALVSRFGHTLERDLVRAYCPMAFDDTGAEWLQAGATIDNPYFGARMLRCGEVRQELPPRGGSHAGHGHE